MSKYIQWNFSKADTTVTCLLLEGVRTLEGSGKLLIDVAIYTQATYLLFRALWHVHCK